MVIFVKSSMKSLPFYKKYSVGITKISIRFMKLLNVLRIFPGYFYVSLTFYLF